MHKYLRAIGFSQIKSREDLKKITEKTIKEYTDCKCSINPVDEIMYADYSYEFGKNMGLKVCGDFDSMDEFSMEYCFPYMLGSRISSNECSSIERMAINSSYAGVCEDNKVSISIIYYLQNRIDYFINTLGGLDFLKTASLYLSGLSDCGMIMMPLAKTELLKKKPAKRGINRNQLIEAARQGDEEAIESLTLDDIDVYSTISRKLKESDVYTIVDTYFMPYGVECDQYGILAEINSVEIVTNFYSGEEVYQLGLICNGIHIDICINKIDLIGEPEVGRRFKGNIWLQGFLTKSEKSNSSKL